MEQRRSPLCTFLWASVILGLSAGSAAAQDASRILTGQVVVSVDFGRAVLNEAVQPGGVLHLAVAFPLTSSTKHWPLEVSFGRSHWHAEDFECSRGRCRTSLQSAAVTYLGVGIRRAASPLCERQAKLIGRFDIGRYFFGKSTDGTSRWGAYSGFSVDVGISQGVAVSGGLGFHVARGPNDGPLHAYFSTALQAHLGFRIAF